MADNFIVRPVSASCSASASATTVLGTITGLRPYDWFVLDAKLIGTTGGVLDIGLQRKIDGVDLWVPWIRFTQAAATTTYVYSIQSQAGSGIVSAGLWDTTASPTAVTSWGIAANSFVGGHPGDQVRVIATTGAGTSVGAAQLLYLMAWQRII
jgi:hypothetical protein